MDNTLNIEQIFRKRGEKPLNKWVYTFILFLSFIWCSCYTIENSFYSYMIESYGKLFSITSPNFFYEVMMLVSMSIIYVLGFELIFFLYRYVISFKIYSFVIPLDRLKADTKIAYSIRNFFFGIYMNLCFLYPYLHSYMMFVSLLITMIMVLIFAKNIYKTYSEPLIAHFVFKTFVYPVFFYEILSMIFSIGGMF